MQNQALLHSSSAKSPMISLPLFANIASGEEFGIIIPALDLYKMEEDDGKNILEGLLGGTDKSDMIDDVRETLGSQLSIPAGDFERSACASSNTGVSLLAPVPARVPKRPVSPDADCVLSSGEFLNTE